MEVVLCVRGADKLLAVHLQHLLLQVLVLALVLGVLAVAQQLLLQRGHVIPLATGVVDMAGGARALVVHQVVR